MVLTKNLVMASSGEEIRLQFLLCGSCEILPASYIKLRSYLNTHITNLADQHNLKVIKNFRNRNKTCLYCYSPWSSDTTSFKLIPSKKSKHSQAQRNAIENVKKKAGQLKQLKNTLVLKCKVCSKKSTFSLLKRKSVEEIVKNEIVESVKKRKKKDKSCGLAINVKKNDSFFPEVNINKKKKRIQSTSDYTSHKISQINESKLMINKLNSLNSNSKNLMLKPYASQIQGKFSKKRGKKLQRLKKAVKEEKNLTRKTLKDFLTLI